MDVATECGEGVGLGEVLPIVRDRVMRVVRILATNRALLQIAVEVTIKLV